MLHDEYTGRYHTQYREYDPVHARWLSEDPAGYQDGLNLYAAYMDIMGVDLLGTGPTFSLDGTLPVGSVYNGEQRSSFVSQESEYLQQLRSSECYHTYLLLRKYEEYQHAMAINPCIVNIGDRWKFIPSQIQLSEAAFKDAGLGGKQALLNAVLMRYLPVLPTALEAAQGVRVSELKNTSSGERIYDGTTALGEGLSLFATFKLIGRIDAPSAGSGLSSNVQRVNGPRPGAEIIETRLNPISGVYEPTINISNANYLATRSSALTLPASYNKFTLSVGPTVSEITSRLKTHVRSAVEIVDAQGMNAFTARQRIAISKKPYLMPMFRGYQIDQMARSTINADLFFNSYIEGKSNSGPDFLCPSLYYNVWWDMTTSGQWQKHLNQYGTGGIHLRTDP